MLPPSPPGPSTSQTRIKWYQSLQVRIIIGLVTVLIAMIIAAIVVLQTLGRSILIDDNIKLLTQSGHRVVTELSQRTKMAEAMTRDLAQLGEGLGQSPEKLHKVVPEILNPYGYGSVIAGGGVWPEPYQFAPDKRRDSYFWGRNQKGLLEFYNDYNDPNGRGYHQEEWYVPAQYLRHEKCYWSKSYMDPYSFEPMVTCTVAITKTEGNNSQSVTSQFIGAATLDLKLQGLKEFFDERAREFGGYIFAVDRNNKLLSFPDTTVATLRTQTSEGTAQEFLTAEELAKHSERFKPVAQALQQINDRIIFEARKKPDFNQQLALDIATGSDQINEEEAALIAATLLDPFDLNNTSQIAFGPLELERDILLNEPVWVTGFLMPETYWKVILVSPERVATSRANEVSSQVSLALVLMLLVAMLAAYIFLQRVLIKPLTRMSASLRTLDAQSSPRHLVLLDDQRADELGQVAYYFNKRTKALQTSEIRFRSVSQTAQDAIVITDDQGLVLDWNHSAEEMFDYNAQEIIHHPIALILPSIDDGQLKVVMGQLNDSVEQQESDTMLEALARRKTGNEIPVEVALSSWLEGNDRFFAFFIRDITDRIRAQKQMQYLAMHDTLTGLPNRVLFNDRLCRALERARRQQQKVILLFLDLDNFKVVNDSLGHEQGDKLLRKVSLRLLKTGRTSDTIARLGGDEFAMIITEIDDANIVCSLADRIIEAISQPYHIEGNEMHIGVSIGITVFPDDHHEPDQLVRNADMAMYRAKGEGKNTYRHYIDEMDAEIQRRRLLQTDLKRALVNNEMFIEYQPQIDIATNRLAGAEALLRWQHPERGRVPPDEFIPLAEQTGLIVEIGDWVLEEVCMQIRAWQDAGLPQVPIAVNLSSVQFRRDDLLERICSAMHAYDINPGLLEFEITESYVMNDPDAAISTMFDMREFGVKISVDDFGTGYSSLGYLRRFPVDKVKIDRSFVTDIEHDKDSATLAKAVVQLGHSLGLKVVAEGVETKGQLEFLQNQYCDLVQGYLFSKPLPARKFSEWLESSSINTPVQHLVS
ncbi:Cache and PAS/PAC sensor-containing signal transduction diguanylate cyclase/phosphodiesterase [Oleiphilus messinensis]|uniref:cyclic-guanylate-specific phosphodiesterase n=2 Tax=Oleiphilus messinensis TaxID=141451 RepID=A0A1Y0I3C9_9GAMM|nr:Cache and PAS/PAC sensor-containing signal transduction diguanylate cyclase/phosphodiesterase [Oleiphilus messinensis]